MEQLIQRIDKCENKIELLAREVTENTVNMRHVCRAVDEFSIFINENIKTLTQIQNQLENMNRNQEHFEQKLCQIEDKVDQNEESFKIDLRPIQKKNFENVLTKIFMILSPIGMIALILYLIFGS